MHDPQPLPLAAAPLAAVPAEHEEAVPAPFRCTFSNQGVGAAWVKASGDLDLADTPQLDRALRDAAASARLVVLDLSELSFIDLTGVRSIVDASVAAALDGRRLMVAFAPAQVQRVFALAGATEAVELLDAEAVARPRPHVVEAA